MGAKVNFEASEGVGVITLDEAASLNACGIDTAQALHAVLDQVNASDGTIRAVILTGAGRAFSSGADLRTAADGASNPNFDLGSHLEQVYNPLLNAIRDLSVPFITAVNGGAAGIGCSIALMGDLVVAGESAYFLQAFRNVGLVPDGGATWLLPQLVGRVRAMEMVLLGEKLDAQTAMGWGLINRLVPDADLQSAAMGLAKKLATGPSSLGVTRRLIHQAQEGGWGAQLQAERVAQRDAGRTKDFAEGMSAFRAKRHPSFTGH